MPTISGNLTAAAAGATVIVVGVATNGQHPQACAPVVADSNGNFTTPSVPANTSSIPTYNVIPILFGKEFSPFEQSVVVSTSNITGLNWTSALTSYALVQDFEDTFQRANSNPASGWTTFQTDAAMQVLSDTFRSTTGGSRALVNGASPTGYAPPADSYCQMQIVASSLHDIWILHVRSNPNGNPFTLGFDVELAATAGTVGALWQLNDVVRNGDLVSGLGFLSGFGSSPFTFNVGDSILLMIYGQHAYLFQVTSAGVHIPLGAGVSTNSPNAGQSGVEMADGTSNTSKTTFKNFIAGHVVAA